MTGFDVYRIYQTVRQHFQNEYFSIEKYGYHSKRVSSVDAYNDINTRRIYESVGANFPASSKRQEEEFARYLASSFMMQNDIWIGDILSDRCKDNYKRYRRFTYNPKIYIIDDLKDMLEKYDGFSALFQGSKTQSLPPILVESITGTIHPETLCLLDRVMSVFDYLDDQMGKEHMVWKGFRQRLQAYKTFVTVRNRQSLDDIHDAIRELLQNSI